MEMKLGSAYFPATVLSNSVKTHVANHSSEQRRDIARTLQIEFPLQRAILWDREVIDTPMFLMSNNIVPSLVLSNQDIRSILQNLVGGQPSLYNCIVTLASPPRGQNDFIFSRPKYVYRMYERSANDQEISHECALALPLKASSHDDDSLLFNAASTA